MRENHWPKNGPVPFRAPFVLRLAACAALCSSMVLPAGRQATAAETSQASPSTIDDAAARVREAYRRQDRGPVWSELPVGVFDSGTGGLSVLEEILKLDAFDNRSGSPISQGDGAPDFCHERFVFLADQANMPYGNYLSLGKTGFLAELIRNDALFLLGREYSVSAEARSPRSGKLPVKAVVIACNTATAYGKADLESLIAKAGLKVPVVGVVDAAARGALDNLLRRGGGTIGVLATEGTVATGAYPAALRRLAVQRAYVGPIDVVQQGSLGLAGAIDGAREFVAQPVESSQPRPDYRGPSLSNPKALVDVRLLPRYDFDFSQHRMFISGDRANPEVLQINSVDNYVRYDVVGLLETVRRGPQAGRLEVVILGCTHFSYCAQAIRSELRRLFDYREHDRYVYREHMAAEVAVVDPALDVAKELYASLARGQTLAAASVLAPGETRGEFYVTAPYRGDPAVKLDERGWFTFEYKYGRAPGRPEPDVRTVPLTPQRLDPRDAERFGRYVPGVWALLRDFQDRNAKCADPRAAF